MATPEPLIAAILGSTMLAPVSHLQWNMFVMREVERPAPLLVAAINHDFDGFFGAAVGFGQSPRICKSL
jgi:hypothetical protein